MPRLPIESCTATTVVMDGRPYLAFGGCNYLGLAHHPRVHEAIARGLARFGISTTASRETTGNTAAHVGLERELAAFLGMNGAILTPEGYTANFAACAALRRDHEVAIIDERTHRSVAHAARAAEFEVHAFQHLNTAHAAALADAHARRGVVVMTDGVFTAEGEIAPLPELLEALPRSRALLLVDDCHGFCVLGDDGRGTLAHFGLQDERLALTTTLAKGLGCYGGAVAGPTRLIATVREHAAIYRGTTPCPPPLAEAAREALRILQREPGLLEALRENIRRMARNLGDLELHPVSNQTPIFAFTLDSTERMERIYAALLERGILAPLIDYPGGSARLYFRITVSASHSIEQIDRLAEELDRAMRLYPPARQSAA